MLRFCITVYAGYHTLSNKALYVRDNECKDH